MDEVLEAAKKAKAAYEAYQSEPTQANLVAAAKAWSEYEEVYNKYRGDNGE
jgi:hypothetical protein